MLKSILQVDVGVLCVLLDELTAWGNLVAHQHGEGSISFEGVLDGDLAQCSVLGIHGRSPQLFRVHFTQTFVSLNVVGTFLDAGTGIFVQNVQSFLFSSNIAFFLVFLDTVERGRSNIYVSLFD